MKILLWLLRGIVFIALFGLAVKNSDSVGLHVYLGGVWHAPLSLVILAAFVIGAVIGLTSTLGPLVRQGRELRRLRNEDARGKEAPKS